MTSEKDTAFEEHARGSGPLDHWTTRSTHRVCIDFMHTLAHKVIYTLGQRSAILSLMGTSASLSLKLALT